MQTLLEEPEPTCAHDGCTRPGKYLLRMTGLKFCFEHYIAGKQGQPA